MKLKTSTQTEGEEEDQQYQQHQQQRGRRYQLPKLRNKRYNIITDSDILKELICIKNL